MFGFFKKAEKVKNLHLFVWDINEETFKYVHTYPADGSVTPCGRSLFEAIFAVTVDDIGKIRVFKNRYDFVRDDLVFSSFADLMFIYGKKLIETSKRLKKVRKGKKK